MAIGQDDDSHVVVREAMELSFEAAYIAAVVDPAMTEYLVEKPSIPIARVLRIRLHARLRCEHY